MKKQMIEILMACAWLSTGPPLVLAQGGRAVSTSGQSILLELGPDDLLPGHPLDLQGKTLRFTPSGGGFHAASMSIQWDPAFGDEVVASPSAWVPIQGFSFPFSGQNWSDVYVGAYGVLTFGADQSALYDAGRDRFLRFRTYAGSMINTVPLIAPLFHKLGVFDPEGVSHQYAKELSDRLVVTWVASEPYLDVFSFTSEPRMNRCQAVLYASGVIDLSYDLLSVQDGIVGVFPLDFAGSEFAAASDPADDALPPYLDVRSVTAELLGSATIRFSFHAAGNMLPPGDPGIEKLIYRVFIDLDPPFVNGIDFGDADLEWGVQGDADGQYHPYGPGISSQVTIDGSTISFLVPIAGLNGVAQFAFFADAVDFATNEFDQVNAVIADLPAVTPPLVDLSALTGAEAPRPLMYEAFYYPDIPDEWLLTPTVIAALGDRFDFFAFYTDFRIDRQETGAVSSGAIGNMVSGVVPAGWQPAQWGSAGQLQCVMQVSYIDTPLAAPSGTDLAGSWTNYNREVTLLGHELGHRWLTLQQALVDGSPLWIGDPSPHWLFELHAPVRFNYLQPHEASLMGGSFWQENGDGTFTNLTQPFFQAGGYSSLDLYLMGLLAKADVPPFSLLQNASFLQYDAQGHPVYTGTPIRLTIDEVIAVSGPRLPEFPDTQRDFNLGLVGVVQHGAAPSSLMLTRLAGFRAAFTSFWTHSTGDVGAMHSIVRGDLDHNWDVDAADLAAWSLCAKGPRLPPPPGCADRDLDGDGDVDQVDFGLLQTLFTGSGH